jgi:hypothetical protein
VNPEAPSDADAWLYDLSIPRRIGYSDKIMYGSMMWTMPVRVPVRL